MGRLNAYHPRDGPRDVPDRGNDEDENEAGAEASDSVSDLANTSLLNEIGKKHASAEREDDCQRRKSFSVCRGRTCHVLCARGLNSKVRARRVRDKKIPQLEEQLKLNADPTGESQPRAYVSRRRLNR